MTSDSDASPDAPSSPLTPVVALPALRGIILAGAVVVSLVALVVVGAVLVRGAATGPVSRAVTSVPGGLGPTGALVLLLAVLLATMGVLSALRHAEERVGQARRARYTEWARQRQAAERAEPTPAARTEPARAGGVEAILVVDLVQSTELIAQHGDEFFRDLLRRVETTFIPVARASGTRCVDGHGDAFLFCFERVEQALEALRGMYARLPEVNRDAPAGVEVAFRASLHVGETVADARGSRAGLAVVKAVRLGSVMEILHGRGAGRNSLVVSAEALPALAAVGVATAPLGEVELRGLPGTHAVYAVQLLSDTARGY